MISLFLDTSHKFLVIGILKDETIIHKTQYECFKKQSETIFVELEKIFNQLKLSPKEISRIYITKGPGSYTGVRIVMVIAKIIASLRNIDIYTINTLQLYAGIKDVAVILDARSNRVYYAKYKNNEELIKPCIKTLDEIDDEDIIGDLSLISKEDKYDDLIENFYLLRDKFEKVNDIHNLVPFYLKDNKEYLNK